MAKSLYEILGVARDADEETLRTAYRRLAREFHPDLNPGDAASEERFKEISRAYAVLNDREKRSQYDEFGEIALEGGFDAEAARQARDAFRGRFDTGEGEFSFGNLDDLLGGIFSRFGHDDGPRPRPRRGMDLEASISLDFADAVRGGEQRVEVARPTADGGVKPERLTVRIPPGVADGGRIRLAGKGAESPGGPPGDLYLNVRVRPHRVFRREGRDLLLEVPVHFREAALGAKIEIPTLDGRATLTLPPGTHSGKRLRLRGKGVPAARGAPAGDLIVTVSIRVPEAPDEEGRRAIEGLAGLENPSLREDLFR